MIDHLFASWTTRTRISSLFFVAAAVVVVFQAPLTFVVKAFSHPNQLTTAPLSTTSSNSNSFYHHGQHSFLSFDAIHSSKTRQRTPTIHKQNNNIITTMASCSMPDKNAPADDGATTNKKACIPCSTMDPSFLLDAVVIQERLQQQQLPGWQLTTVDDQHRLERSFVAKNFQTALNALNRMGAVAEEQNHHPDFHLTEYRNVRIVLWTHSVGGVTESDLTLAGLLDEAIAAPEYYSPKWLKENAS